MRPSQTNRPETNAASPEADAETLAIRALAWTLGEQHRAERLLALTGLDATELRRRVDEPLLLASVIDFLNGHEPDLLACADALGVPPAAVARLADRLRA